MMVFGLLGFLGIWLSLSAKADWTCPATLPEWEGWRSRQIIRLLKDPNRYDTFDEIEAEFKRCMEALSLASPQIELSLRPCMKGLFDLGQEVSAKVTDRKLIDEHRTRIPLPSEVIDFFMRKEFFAASKDVHGPGFLAEMTALREKFPASRILKHHDEIISMDTVVIHVTEGRFERYVHLLSGHLMVSTVETRDANGKKLEPAVIYFGMIGQEGDGPPHLTNDRPASCFSCHRTGPVAMMNTEAKRRTAEALLGPVQQWTRVGAEEQVQEFNQSLSAHALVRMHGDENIPRQAPPYGKSDASGRTPEFIEWCSQSYLKGEKFKQSRQKVAAAMSCAGCHDGIQVQPLRYPFAPGGFGDSVIQHAIAANSMPKGTPLTPEERNALSVCLTAEYFGSEGTYEKSDLYRYLTSVSCRGSQLFSESACVQPPGKGAGLARTIEEILRRAPRN